MNELLLGFPCIIAQQIKRQKKTSRYRIINWIYKKIYGYEYESTLPDGVGVVVVDGKYVFRDQETFYKVKEIIDKGL